MNVEKDAAADPAPPPPAVADSATAERRRQGREVEALAERLQAVAVRLARAVQRASRTGRVSGARLSALAALVARGVSGLGELAAIEHVRPPTMTRLVQSLERDGLVAREPDPRDHRAVRLRATARGEALLRAGRARGVAEVARLLAGLEREDVAALARAASILLELLE